MKKRIGSLNILGDKWTVYKTDELPQRYAGLCEGQTQSIYLSDELEGNDFRRVFLHEFGHAICSSLGLHHTGFSSEVEELLADALSKAITHNLKTVQKFLK